MKPMELKRAIKEKTPCYFTLLSGSAQIHCLVEFVSEKTGNARIRITENMGIYRKGDVVTLAPNEIEAFKT